MDMMTSDITIRPNYIRNGWEQNAGEKVWNSDRGKFGVGEFFF